MESRHVVDFQSSVPAPINDRKILQFDGFSFHSRPWMIMEIQLEHLHIIFHWKTPFLSFTRAHMYPLSKMAILSYCLRVTLYF